MPYFFWGSRDWFRGSLCCRYLVVRFDRLRVPTRQEEAIVNAEWHWALGFFTDGQFQVLGAWRDEGAATPQRIATDLHDRGIERIKALAGEDSLTGAMGRLRPKVCGRSTSELAERGAFGARMLGNLRWTETAAQRLQRRMQGALKNHGPFDDDAAAADFLAQAFQRADRDLLHDRWDRKHPAPYGQGAFVASLARAA